MSRPALSLQLTEARDRQALLATSAYDVTLDLTVGDDVFASRSAIRFTSEAGRTFLDLRPVALRSASLDERPLDVGTLERGRLPLDLTAGEHELVVEGLMAYRNDGEGLHRAVDPADGRVYVYGMSFLDAAPTVFGCFDQPDLKAAYTLHVTAPPDWLVRGNGRAERVQPGRWELTTTAPLSTYFVTLLAGPYHELTDSHDGIALRLSSRQSLATSLDRDAGELFTMTKQCFDEYHRLFGIRYAFGDYHQAFVPEFNAGAMENPGLVTFRDALLFPSRPTRSELTTRAMTVAHEMAHQWFGNLVTLAWWDDLWLNESLAEYLGYRVAAEVTEYTDAYVQNAYVRKVWGLVADSRPTTHPVAGNGAVDAASALQDFDGISYAKGSAALSQLSTLVGDDVFVAGVREHVDRHRFGNATMQDLVTAWEDAGAGDLSGWTDAWLRTSGYDRLELDRAAGTVRRTPPEGQDVRRPHALHVARYDGSGWVTVPLAVDGEETPVDVGDAPAVLDPAGETWADVALDPVTVATLPDLLSTMDDAMTRATVMNAVRMGVFAGRISPSDALRVVLAFVAVEELDAGLDVTTTWTARHLLTVVPDPGAARAALHDALRPRLRRTDLATGTGLALLRGLVATSSDVPELEGWLRDGVPDAPPVDVDLRWRLLRRLTRLGATDCGRLDRELAEEDRSDARVHHAWCRAALPDGEGKEWAWRRFRGEDEVPNYELEATGLGFWQPDQADLLAAHVGRYFAEVAGTAAVRQGWMLGTATRAFYPLTEVSPATVRRAESALARRDLDLTVRRALLDLTDEVRRRIAARALG